MMREIRKKLQKKKDEEDIPDYKRPTGKERRRTRRKGKKSRFKVGSKTPESKGSETAKNHLRS